MIVNNTPTEAIKRRYNRLARFYDWMEAPMESMLFKAWRSRFQDRIIGPSALEVGVGTGKNMPYYPSNVKITAIDFSPSMLERAQSRSALLETEVRLLEMDVQRLTFPDQTFDTVFAAFVFCSVPDPIQGLMELRRVVKPNGRLLLLEHMRPENIALGAIFDAINPVIVQIMGANVNRKTVDNVKAAGWVVETEAHLSSDVVRWIEARPD